MRLVSVGSYDRYAASFVCRVLLLVEIVDGYSLAIVFGALGLAMVGSTVGTRSKASGCALLRSILLPNAISWPTCRLLPMAQ
jgi:hypothetical protein